MKISLTTMRPEVTKKEQNLEKMEKSINQNKADIHVFGEITLTGYRCKDELRDLAEPINGTSIKKMKKIAKKNNSYIIFGMPLKDEKIEGLVYNSAILVHPDGKINTYNKWFLPTFGPFKEKIFFDQGEKLPVFQTKFGKIGIIICYDLFFPETCKALSLQGADIIFCISASPTISRKYFETLLPARAIENTVFMVYTNIVGTQEDLTFWGGSQVYDPLANLLLKAPYFKENISSCSLDLKKVKFARENRPVLRDIRPEIYSDLFDLSRNHAYTKK